MVDHTAKEIAGSIAREIATTVGNNNDESVRNGYVGSEGRNTGTVAMTIAGEASVGAINLRLICETMLTAMIGAVKALSRFEMLVSPVSCNALESRR